MVKRRERTRMLIELGGLVVKAGLVDLADDDRATIYGAFLSIAAKLQGEERNNTLDTRAMEAARQAGVRGGSENERGRRYLEVSRPAQPLSGYLGDVLRLLLGPGNPRWRQRIVDDIS